MFAVTLLSAAVKRFQSAMISRFTHITRFRMRQIGIRHVSHQVAGRHVCHTNSGLVRGFIPAVGAFSIGWKKKNTESATDPRWVPQQVIAKADALYSQNAISELYSLLLPYRECEDDEVLWRLARATCDKAKQTADKQLKKALTYEAFEFVKRALQLNNNNFSVHKWYAILLDYTGEYEGTKQRITNSYQVKEHFMKAIELNPKDATSVYSLGYWCFLFADMPWYTQKVAAMIFATPPKSTYEEALSYFLDAENIDPDFYSMNLLMIGKTYLRLENSKMALLYLTRARDYMVKTEDDKNAHKEAVELLKSLGVHTDKA